MKILRKYIWLILIPLLLVGCAKGPGRVRLKPSNIVVDAGENDVNVQSVNYYFHIFDIYTYIGEDQAQTHSDPTFHIIDSQTAQGNPGILMNLEAENDWIHVKMNSENEMTVHVKKNETGKTRKGVVTVQAIAVGTVGRIQITQTAK